MLGVFSDNLKENDEYVKNFVYSITGTKNKCYDKFCNKIMFNEQCPSTCLCKF